MAGYRLKSGELSKQNPTEAEMWEALKHMLTDSAKVTTYKHAFLLSVLECCKRQRCLVLSFDMLFFQFAQDYWELLIQYDLPQIRKSKRYRESLVETVIRGEIDRGGYTAQTSFQQLSEEVKARIGDNIIRYAPQNVVGAFYEDTGGLFYGFSKAAKEITLSATSRTFLSHYQEPIKLLNEVFWIQMIGELNGGALPAELITRKNQLFRDISQSEYKEVLSRYFEDIAQASAVDTAEEAGNEGNFGMLNTIDNFIEEAKVLLNRNLAQYIGHASSLQTELEEVAKSGNFKNSMVQTRVKTESSLAEKIYRKNYHSKYATPKALIDMLPDMIGARIVCLLDVEEESLYRHLCQVYCNTCEIDGQVFHYRTVPPDADKLYLQLYDQPEKQKNGHDIYRITCKWYSVEKATYTNVELQIKSMIHYFWGELDHMLFYKNYAYLISGTFYSQYMTTVNAELKNIDSQLSILKEQLEKDDDKTIKEIKQIASLLLYNKYHQEIEDKIKCTIDLREVFDLLVDLFFQNTADINTIHQQFYNLISQTP